MEFFFVMNELLTNQPTIETTVELPNSGKSAAKQQTAAVIDNKTKTIQFSTPTKFIESKAYVGKSPIQGLGCFAKQNINSGEIIEEVSAILLDTTTKSNRDWVVSKYCFTWSMRTRRSYLCRKWFDICYANRKCNDIQSFRCT